MKKSEQEHIEKLDVESLIVDLLACGLGACIILFFIFAIQIIGGSMSGGSGKTKANSEGAFSGHVALVGDDGDQKGRMGAVRIIELSGLSAEDYQRIKTYFSEHPGTCWDSRNWNDKKLQSTLHYQVVFNPGSVSFIVMADGMREITFTFPEDLRQKFAVPTRIPAAQLNVSFIEGKTSGNGNSGEWAYHHENGLNSLADFSVRLLTGKISPESIGKLVRVTLDKNQ